MSDSKSEQKCRQCDNHGIGNYCNHCGQSYAIRRITVAGIIHEIFHFFSHLDKGFLYTLRMLIVSPGSAQRAYIEGHRAKHQKPFSMFFLCATITMFIYYWCNILLIKHFDAGNSDEANFFHQYMVILQVTMLPVYAFITYAFFFRSKYNYAETFILILYTLSFLLLISAILQTTKFIWPSIEVRFLELPLIVVYNLLTNFKFYEGEPRWLIVLKTILSSAVCFLIAGLIQDSLIDFLF